MARKPYQSDGCPWRMIPNNFPPWKTFCSYFREWRLCDVWKKINDPLKKFLRRRAGKVNQPTAAIMDSQSVKTTSIVLYILLRSRSCSNEFDGDIKPNLFPGRLLLPCPWL